MWVLLLIVFFFSSRRRHTRYWRDWSSDVCSSDLRAVRALRRFTVRASLPEELMPLSQLVTNLRWSWHPETRDLFEALYPNLRGTCNGDPVKVLGEVSAEQIGRAHV